MGFFNSLLELISGLRLWFGAEFHVDGLMWQGFGFSDAQGIDGFPNGEAFRLGTDVPNGSITRLFIRQTTGEQETVPDDQFQLAGTRDISCINLTVGRFSAKDIFDNNTYANDSRSQFMAGPSWPTRPGITPVTASATSPASPPNLTSPSSAATS